MHGRDNSYSVATVHVPITDLLWWSMGSLCSVPLTTLCLSNIAKHNITTGWQRAFRELLIPARNQLTRFNLSYISYSHKTEHRERDNSRKNTREKSYNMIRKTAENYISRNRPVSQIRATSGGLSWTSWKLWQDYSNCYMSWT